MTKEELFNKLLGYGSLNEATLTSILEPFFSQNICIHKGENRHRDADILHEIIENANGQRRAIEHGYKANEWEDWKFYPVFEFRIKPSEPIYEWQWCIVMDDGTASIYGYHTEDAINELFNKRNKFRIDATKRIRK